MFRLHLLELRHPIVNDNLYNLEQFNYKPRLSVLQQHYQFKHHHPRHQKRLCNYQKAHQEFDQQDQQGHHEIDQQGQHLNQPDQHQYQHHPSNRHQQELLEAQKILERNLSRPEICGMCIANKV